MDASLTSPLIDFPSETILRLSLDSFSIPVASAFLNTTLLEPISTIPTLFPSILLTNGRGVLLIGNLDSDPIEWKDYFILSQISKTRPLL